MSATVGWYLLAFLPELEEGINPLEVGGQSVIAIRCGGEVTVFDATCPHRGANLGYGGKLDRDCIVCPFHGKRIKLGGDAQKGCPLDSITSLRPAKPCLCGLETIRASIVDSRSQSKKLPAPIRSWLPP